MVNGIDGKVGTTSFEWPQPYLAIDTFWYQTANPNSFCPQGAYADSAGDSCLCVFDNDVNFLIKPGYNGDHLSATTYPLHTTLYQTLKANAMQPNFDNRGEDEFFYFNNTSFSEWLISNTVLKSLMPDLRSCTFLSMAMGPPAIKIPVAALTTTTTTTIEKSGYYSHSSTPRPAVGPTKAEAPHTFRSSDSPNPIITVSAEGSYGPVPLTSAQIPQKSQDGSNQGQNGQNGENPSNKDYNQNSSVKKGQSSKNQGGNHDGVSHDSNDENKTYQPSVSPNFEIPPSVGDLPVITAAAANPAPAIRWAGSTIKPDEFSYYDLPGVGNISPGGPALTTNNVVYSLVPSATAILSNGKMFSLTPVTAIDPQPQHAPTLVVAGSTYTADSSNHFVVASQTLVPGGSPVSVAGVRVSIAPGGFVAVVGSSTQILRIPTPEQSAVFTFAGSTFTASSSNIIVAGQTLKSGGSGIVVSGTSISLDAAWNSLIVGSKTQRLEFLIPTPAPRASPVITIDGSRYTANNASQYIVNGQTLAPGGIIILASKSVFLDSGGSVQVVDSSSVVLGGPALTQAPPRLTFAGSIYTANPFGDFVVASQALTPGGDVTVSGTGISLFHGGTIAVIGGSTQLLYSAAVTDAPALTLGGSIFTANNAGHFLIADQTLTMGGDITVSGTHISLSPNGIVAIDGSSGQILAPFHVTKKVALIFAGSTYTADGPFRFVIDGQTLSQGGGISVHGTLISIPSGENYFMIGTSTQEFSTAMIPFVDAPTITFAGSTYTENSVSEFVMDGLTLTKGGFITIQGSRISLDPNGSDVVVGTKTQKIFIDSITGPAVPVITFGDSTYFENSASDFVIESQTLSKGGVITVDGTAVFFSAAGTAVAVIETGISTETVGLGHVIMNEFNGRSTRATISTTAAVGGGVSPSIFTGDGHSNRKFMWTLSLLEVLSLLVLDMSLG